MSFEYFHSFRCRGESAPAVGPNGIASEGRLRFELGVELVGRRIHGNDLVTRRRNIATVIHDQPDVGWLRTAVRPVDKEPGVRLEWRDSWSDLKNRLDSDRRCNAGAAAHAIRRRRAAIRICNWVGSLHCRLLYGRPRLHDALVALLFGFWLWGHSLISLRLRRHYELGDGRWRYRHSHNRCRWRCYRRPVVLSVRLRRPAAGGNHHKGGEPKPP